MWDVKIAVLVPSGQYSINSIDLFFYIIVELFSALLEHFISPGEQVLFHTEGTCTSKSEFSVHRAILHQFTQFFFLHLLKKKETQLGMVNFERQKFLVKLT